MRAKDGAWLVDHIGLIKAWLLHVDIKARIGGGRCFGTCSGAGATWRTSAMPTIGSIGTPYQTMRYFATLSRLQYQESQRSVYWELLKSDIANHLLPKHPLDIKSQDPNPSFTWSTTGTSTVFNDQ